MCRKIIGLFFLLFCSIIVFAQSYSLDGWHLKDDSIFSNGISLDKTYDTLLRGQTSQPVIVAVIDSGVDAEHEDLVEVMWINPGEIPENGMDDDKNGYVDDIHGWNFIGGSDGQNVTYDTYEATRIYKKWRYKFENAIPGKMDKMHIKDYEIFQSAKKTVEIERKKAERNLAEINAVQTRLFESLYAVQEALNDAPASDENLDTISTFANQQLYIGVQILKNINSQLDTLIELGSLIEIIEEDFNLDKEAYQKKVDYGYNIDYDPRGIVGDNYMDASEKYYGNNDVEGPDARHGTHVAGVIAASRANGLGVQGVADNVRIMAIRAVPDGDERDKDVANAIRYAVDNGASVINMSFGKGFSWNKQIVDEAIQYAQKKDVLLVHASGNSNMNIDVENNFPNDQFEKPKGFLFCKKKEATNWLEVGALSYESGENMLAPFTNYGKESVDVFAPGMAIYSTTPNDTYEMLQGTSFAGPIVAGTAALLRSYFPGLKAKQVKEIIMQSSDQISTKVLIPGSEETTYLHEISRSGGIVNVYEAVTLASKTKGKKKLKKFKDQKA